MAFGLRPAHLLNRRLQFLPISAADFQSRTVSQDDFALSTYVGADIAHSRQIDDRGSMNSAESLRLEISFKVRHATPKKVRLPSGMQTSIIVRRFNPIDLLDAQK